MDEMLAIVESRCSLDPEGESAFKFLSEWIEVSKEMGLDPNYVNQYQQTLMDEPQERLF